MPAVDTGLLQLLFQLRRQVEVRHIPQFVARPLRRRTCLCVDRPQDRPRQLLEAGRQMFREQLGNHLQRNELELLGVEQRIVQLEREPLGPEVVAEDLELHDQDEGLSVLHADQVALEVDLLDDQGIGVADSLQEILEAVGQPVLRPFDVVDRGLGELELGHRGLLRRLQGEKLRVEQLGRQVVHGGLGGMQHAFGNPIGRILDLVAAPPPSLLAAVPGRVPVAAMLVMLVLAMGMIGIALDRPDAVLGMPQRAVGIGPLALDHLLSRLDLAVEAAHLGLGLIDLALSLFEVAIELVEEFARLLRRLIPEPGEEVGFHLAADEHVGSAPARRDDVEAERDGRIPDAAADLFLDGHEARAVLEAYGHVLLGTEKLDSGIDLEFRQAREAEIEVHPVLVERQHLQVDGIDLRVHLDAARAGADVGLAELAAEEPDLAVELEAGLDQAELGVGGAGRGEGEAHVLVMRQRDVVGCDDLHVAAGHALGDVDQRRNAQLCEAAPNGDGVGQALGLHVEGDLGGDIDRLGAVRENGLAGEAEGGVARHADAELDRHLVQLKAGNAERILPLAFEVHEDVDAEAVLVEFELESGGELEALPLGHRQVDIGLEPDVQGQRLILDEETDPAGERCHLGRVAGALLSARPLADLDEDVDTRRALAEEVGQRPLDQDVVVNADALQACGGEAGRVARREIGRDRDAVAQADARLLAAIDVCERLLGHVGQLAHLRVDVGLGEDQRGVVEVEVGQRRAP